MDPHLFFISHGQKMVTPRTLNYFIPQERMRVTEGALTNPQLFYFSKRNEGALMDPHLVYSSRRKEGTLTELYLF